MTDDKLSLFLFDNQTVVIVVHEGGDFFLLNLQLDNCKESRWHMEKCIIFSIFGPYVVIALNFLVSNKM